MKNGTCGECAWWVPYSIWHNRASLPPDSVFKGHCHGAPPTAESGTKRGHFPVIEHTAWCAWFSPKKG